MTRIEKGSSSRWKQWLAALVATLAMINVGNEEFWLLRTLKNVVNSDFVPEEYEDYALVGFFIFSMSSVFGAILGAVLADRFGRRSALLSTSIFAIGQIIGIFSTDAKLSCVSLFLGEIGAGITRVAVPLYVSEIAADNVRGALLMLQLPFFYGGKLIAVGIGSIMPVEIVCSILVILTGIFLASFIWFPETPHYLVSRKKYPEATNSLIFYRGVKTVEADAEVELMINNFAGVDNSNRGCCGKTRELCRPSNRKGLLIILFLILAKWSEQSLDSRNDLVRYLMEIIVSNYYDAKIITYAISFVCSLLIVFTVDIIGRRSFLLCSTFVGFMLVIITLFIGNNQSYQWVYHANAITLHFCQLIILAIPLAYVGELFSTNVKALAISMVTTFNLLISFVIILVVEVAYVDINSFVLGIIILISFPVTLAFAPETKRKSFSSIQRELDKSVPIQTDGK